MQRQQDAQHPPAAADPDDLSPQRRRLFELLRNQRSTVDISTSAAYAHRSLVLRAGHTAAGWRSNRQHAATVEIGDAITEAEARHAVLAVVWKYPRLASRVLLDPVHGPELRPGDGPVELGVADPAAGDRLACTAFIDGEPLSRWWWLPDPARLLVSCHELIADRYALHQVLLPAWLATCAGAGSEPLAPSPGVALEPDFWASELNGSRSPLPAPPNDVPARPVSLRLPDLEPLLSPVVALGRRMGSTPATTLLAAWVGALADWSGLDEVTVTVCARNRTDAASVSAFGHLQTVVPVRVRLGADRSRSGMIAATRTAANRAYAHPGAPPDRTVYPAFGLLDPAPVLSHGGQAIRVTELATPHPVGTFSLDVVNADRPAASLVFDPRTRGEPARNLPPVLAATLRRWADEPGRKD